MALPEVIDSWELNTGETPESFSQRVYGAKFAIRDAQSKNAPHFYLISDATSYGPCLMIVPTDDDFMVSVLH